MNHQTIRDYKECIVSIFFNVSCLCEMPIVIEAIVSKTQLQAHIRDTRAANAIVMSYVTKEDLTLLQKSLQKHILKNRTSIIIILPS